MSSNKIYLASPHMSEEGYEKDYIKEAFDSNWIAPLGKNVDEFERSVAAYIGVKSGAALVSGTAAIHLALKAAGVGRGDVVFCQSLTFVGTANPILYEGAKPIFIDSERETWNMDPVLLEEAFQKHPNTKAVLVVHLYGVPAKIQKIKEVCDRHGATLIEDAAESLGSTYRGQPTGSFGDYGIVSFNGNKIITTSGGGMVVSNHEDTIKKIRSWSTQSKEPGIYYNHKEVGYNYRMSNIVAGIGRGQMKVLDQRVNRKREIYSYYKDQLGDIPGVGFLPEVDDAESNCWLSVITFQHQKPSDILTALQEANIEGRPVWKPMHLQPLFAGAEVFGGKVSEEFFERGLCLPSDTKLSDDDLARIVHVVREACGV